jgi:hypothetical protein
MGCGDPQLDLPLRHPATQTMVEEVAAECLYCLARVDLRTVRGERRRTERRREEARRLEALGQAWLAQMNYERVSATRKQAAALVSAVASDHPITERAMRTRERLLQRAYDHFHISRRAGPLHRGRPPDSRKSVDNTYRQLTQVFDRVHAQARRQGLRPEEADRLASLALCGDPTARKRLGLTSSERPDAKVRRLLSKVGGNDLADSLLRYRDALERGCGPVLPPTARQVT